MQNKPKIYKLEGVIQHYAWGGYEFLPSLLRTPNPSKTPFAEYWLGAHVNAPSSVILADRKQPLDKFIDNEPAGVLGTPVYNVFGQLPYLLKVLDVKDMLSIQVHPSKQAAEKEFKNENKKGIALSARHRNYKDQNHKPELMLALGPFWLLHGFKPMDKLRQTLREVAELNFLLPVFAEGNYRALYQEVMTMEQRVVNEKLLPLISRIERDYDAGVLTEQDEHFWAARAFKTFCAPGYIDRGIFSIYFFNIVQLQKEEAIFQDAGILHAYLQGQNIEIMSSSDNVLRGGLTNKHIDVGELMKHVQFTATTPEIITGLQLDDSAENIFPSPASDFELRQLTLAAQDTEEVITQTLDIFFVYEGDVQVQSGENMLHLRKGEALVAVADSRLNWSASSETTVFRATVPRPAL